MAGSAEVVIRVPEDAASIPVAVSQVPNGGTIDLAAGTYFSPAPNGFSFSNLGKGFTIRAREGATVVLDGAGIRPVFRLINGSAASARTVVFEGLQFKNGRSTTNGQAGGVTLIRARATFVDCLFEGNDSDAPSTGGGGIAVFTDSVAVFNRCTWLDNVATNEGAGLRVGGNASLPTEATAFVHDSEFINNRVNLPGHRPSSAGGAIHVGDGRVWVTNTRFEGNQAGLAGGAIFAIGSWVNPVTVPESEVVIANCTFIDNEARLDAGVSNPTPTSGGAIHVENQTTLEVHNSRFITNTGDAGGAISGYRAILTAHDTVFLGNRAIGTGASNGFGGAIAFSSADTPVDGSNNRRPAEVTITDSLIQGRYGAVGTVGLIAGGLFVNGDLNRNYGLGGVTPLGTDAANRATVVLDNVVFDDCDVLSTLQGTGIAGAINLALVDLTMSDSLVIDSDADSFGGAMRIAVETSGQIVSSTFARNSAESFGGALLIQGSDVDITGCEFYENEISPGTSESVGASFGAAIFSGIVENFAGNDFDVTGTVSDSIFSKNVGLPIYEDDRADMPGNPRNLVTYQNNDFFNTTFGSSVYRNALTPSAQSVSGLNSLMLHGTAKSPLSDNAALGSAATLGVLKAVPTRILTQVAAGDAESATKSYLGYAWSGPSSAELDDDTIFDEAGVAETTAGPHSLMVGAVTRNTSIPVGPTPAASFTATPQNLDGGQSTTLSWATTAGNFLDSFIDQEVDTGGAASGSTLVTPPATTTYGLCVVTRQGGVAKERTVFVDEFLIFADGFESGSTSQWSSTVQ